LKKGKGFGAGKLRRKTYWGGVEKGCRYLSKSLGDQKKRKKRRERT